MTIDYKSLGKRIKENRRRNRMTQATLAERTDRCNEYISRVETGKKKTSLELLVRISRVLNVSLDELVFGEKSPF